MHRPASRSAERCRKRAVFGGARGRRRTRSVRASAKKERSGGDSARKAFQLRRSLLNGMRDRDLRLRAFLRHHDHRLTRRLLTGHELCHRRGSLREASLLRSCRHALFVPAVHFVEGVAR